MPTKLRLNKQQQVELHRIHENLILLGQYATIHLRVQRHIFENAENLKRFLEGEEPRVRPNINDDV